MQTDLRAQWLTFLDGHWQWTIPSMEGTYFRRTLDGLDGGIGVVYKERDTGRFKSASIECGGYWWSVPIPGLPHVETEEDAHESLERP